MRNEVKNLNSLLEKRAKLQRYIDSVNRTITVSVQSIMKGELSAIDNKLVTVDIKPLITKLSNWVQLMSEHPQVKAADVAAHFGVANTYASVMLSRLKKSGHLLPFGSGTYIATNKLLGKKVTRKKGTQKSVTQKGGTQKKGIQKVAKSSALLTKAKRADTAKAFEKLLNTHDTFGYRDIVKSVKISRGYCNEFVNNKIKKGLLKRVKPGVFSKA